MSPRSSAAAAALLAACAAPPGALQQFGGMRQVMRAGQTEPRVRLADLELRADTVAVGALADLAGEITVAAGRVHVATAADGTFHAEAAGDRWATLLTIATPNVVIERPCAEPLDEQQLERLVRATHLPGVVAIDVRGRAAALDLHVARGACPHGEPTPATEPWRWSAPADSPVRLVGFFAPGQAGVMTHHGTSFHLHAIAEPADGERSGHVDSFRLQPGASVRIGALPH